MCFIPGIKNGSLNAEGLAPANVAKTSFIREIIRNPKLIEKQVKRDIFNLSEHIKCSLPFSNPNVRTNLKVKSHFYLKSYSYIHIK